jgi:hypothetical protein
VNLGANRQIDTEENPLALDKNAVSELLAPLRADGGQAVQLSRLRFDHHVILFFSNPLE